MNERLHSTDGGPSHAPSSGSPGNAVMGVGQVMGHAVQLRAGPRPGIIRLWLQRRDRPANLVDDLMIDDLHRAIDALEAMSDLAGVLLESGGRDFLAGADLTRLDALRDPARSHGFSTAFHAATRRLERLDAPVVALIAGACMGGGFELALAADARLAVAGRFAIGCPEAAIGTMPGGGGTQRLPRLIGRLPALAMLAAGRTLDPDAAWDTGILDAPPFADIAAAETAAWQIIQAIHAGDPSVLRRPSSDEQSSSAGATAEEAGILSRARALRHRRPGVLATCTAVLDGQSLDLDAALALEAGRFAALMAQPEPHRLVAGGFLAGRALARGIGRPALPVLAPAAPRVRAGDGCAAVGIAGDGGAAPAMDGDVTLVVLTSSGPVSGPVVPAACPDGCMGVVVHGPGAEGLTVEVPAGLAPGRRRIAELLIPADATPGAMTAAMDRLRTSGFGVAAVPAAAGSVIRRLAGAGQAGLAALIADGWPPDRLHRALARAGFGWPLVPDALEGLADRAADGDDDRAAGVVAAAMRRAAADLVAVGVAPAVIDVLATQGAGWPAHLEPLSHPVVEERSGPS